MLNMSSNCSKAVLVSTFPSTHTCIHFRGWKRLFEVPHPLQKALPIQYFLFHGRSGASGWRTDLSRPQPFCKQICNKIVSINFIHQGPLQLEQAYLSGGYMLEFNYFLSKDSYASKPDISLGLWRAESCTPYHLILQQSFLGTLMRIKHTAGMTYYMFCDMPCRLCRNPEKCFLPVGLD